jgi:hypothetical protein
LIRGGKRERREGCPVINLRMRETDLPMRDVSKLSLSSGNVRRKVDLIIIFF